VEEIHETPVDITCCNSKYCPNEDRPASAADEGRDSRYESANCDTETLVLLVSVLAEEALIFLRAVISVKTLFLHLLVQRIFQRAHYY